MGMIKQYTVVSTSNAAVMSAQVTELLKQGWELHGGLVVAQTAEGARVSSTFAQALTRMVDAAQVAPANAELPAVKSAIAKGLTNLNL